MIRGLVLKQQSERPRPGEDVEKNRYGVMDVVSLDRNGCRLALHSPVLS
jgi:hypothetical protein